MPNKKVTGSKAATAAAKVLQNPKSTPQTKSVAASALSQTDAPKKQTSPGVSSKASDVLRRVQNLKAKMAAGSALSQTRKK